VTEAGVSPLTLPLSYGCDTTGYTALALAGAKLNFPQLQSDCCTLDNSLNLSLVLQCLALQLPNQPYNLADPRIKAAIALESIASVAPRLVQTSCVEADRIQGLPSGNNQAIALMSNDCTEGIPLLDFPVMNLFTLSTPHQIDAPPHFVDMYACTGSLLGYWYNQLFRITTLFIFLFDYISHRLSQ